MATFYTIGSGGAVAGGSGEVQPFLELGSGGAMSGGNAKVTPFNMDAGGGALVSGSSKVSPFDEIASGGAILKGTADVELVGEKVVRFHYKAFNLQSDQNVVFDVWDQNGVVLGAALPAIEIDSKGVYYLDFATPLTDLYLLAKGRLAIGTKEAAIVETCGNPSETVFWADEQFRTGLITPYEIYDADGTIEQSGNLTEVAGGFYKADVSSLDLESLHLFDVDGKTAAKFGSIGFVVSGGVIVGGAAGLDAQIFNEVGQGGALVGGLAETIFIDQVQGSGGALTGGVADVTAIYNPLSVGGAIAGGLADTDFADIIETAGGALVGGVADVVAIYNPIAVGGSVVGGRATLATDEEATGGALAGGVAEFFVVFIPTITGGAIAGGEAEEIAVAATIGGVLTGGVADVFAVYNPAATGGAIGGGTGLGDTFNEVGTGGAIGGGTALTGNNFVEVGSGGALVGGVPDVTDDFFNKGRNRFHRFGIGDGVYLRYQSRTNLPSRYEKHVVEGFRFLDNVHLYDIGIGILVHERFLVSDLNIGVVVSDEATETQEWSFDQIDKIEGTTPLADPSGGIVSETDIVSDGGAAEVAASSSVSDEKEKLESITPLPDPVGGTVSESTTFAPEDDRSAILNRLKNLQGTTPLPDPVGGTVSSAPVENTNRFAGLADTINAKLAALQNTPVIPAPVGGSLLVSHTEGVEENRITSVQKKLKELEDVALIPGPSGAYILVSIDTEGTDKFKNVRSDIVDKIRKLGIQAAQDALDRAGAGV